VATYLSPSGEPRVTLHSVALPLHLACRPKPAAKAAQFKVTLDTEHPAQPLTDLFDDFLLSAHDLGTDVGELLGSSAAQAMGFQFWSNSPLDAAGPSSSSSSSSSSYQLPAVVSILVSKAAGRYRVQSDSLPALLLIVAELEQRLSVRLAHINGGGGGNAAGGRNRLDSASASTSLPPGSIKCEDPLPLAEFFATITAHFETRRSLNDLLSRLNDTAHQFRMVQKRLLVRFKDRNPTPLGGLDSLMRESYNTLLRLSEWTQSYPKLL
jgi:Bardet-Biedl syndrome 9 protein